MRKKLIDKAALVAEIDRQKIGYNVDGKHSVEYDTTRKILNIIDTLEVIDVNEEPVSSIWHDASEKSNEPEDIVIINLSDNTGEVLTKCTGVYQGRIWAYTSVLLNLDNPCKIGKNLQKEPVSNDLEDYAKKESESFAEREYEIDYIDRNALAKGYFWGVKDGAKWQKEQMEKEVDLEKEKIEWSEEDEEIMSGLLSFLLINTSDQWAKYGKWLKSLKQRIEDKL